jgi:phosphoenolpyruvate carboxylase
VGAALEALQIERPDEFAQLSQHLYTWAPLHYALSNAATCITAADLDVMREYAALVEDELVRERVLALITGEFERTCRMLERVYRGTLAERRPNINGTVQIRKAPLFVLHRQQIALLRRWRAARGRGHEGVAAALLSSLLLTVNAIASGLGATG